MCISICKLFAECFLGWMNSLVTLLGLAILALGGFCIWFVPNLQPMVETLLRMILNFGLLVDLTQSRLIIDSLMAAAKPIGICLVIAGAVIVAVAILGCCAMCCKSRFLMSVYSVLLGTLALAFLSLGVVFSADSTLIVKPLANVLSKQNQMGYQDPFRTDCLYQNTTISIFSVLTSYLMVSLDCCGIDSPFEFQRSEFWDQTYWNPYTNSEIKALVPTACCLMNFSAQMNDATMRSPPPKEMYQCMENPNPVNYPRIAHSCASRFTEKPYSSIIVIILYACCAALTCFFVHSYYLANQYQKINRVYPEPRAKSNGNVIILTDGRRYSD